MVKVFPVDIRVLWEGQHMFQKTTFRKSQRWSLKWESRCSKWRRPSTMPVSNCDTIKTNHIYYKAQFCSYRYHLKGYLQFATNKQIVMVILIGYMIKCHITPRKCDKIPMVNCLTLLIEVDVSTCQFNNIMALAGCILNILSWCKQQCIFV